MQEGKRRGRSRFNLKNLYEMNITTYNCNNSWENVRNFLGQTSAHVAFLQEVRAIRVQIDDHSAKLEKMGWLSVWAPSLTTDKEGFTSGVAIAVRKGIGLRETPGGRSLQKAGWSPQCSTCPGGPAR